MADGTSLLALAIIMAALVIKTALGELRQPGSARQQWAFSTDRYALAAGAIAAAATVLLGWQEIGAAAAAWALLIGALTAHLIHEGPRRP
ncbi:hypothetical protein AB0D57_08875 [Streptomyces sp. NPDC048275]|uniref:hypothetical protein n=1 Tax=Streptomyces sp. NPDC048275 TaxID=3155629 RepID=UPI0033E5B9BB